MSWINEVYERLAEIYAADLQIEDFKSRMQKLVEEGKSKEEAVLVLAIEKGLWIPEIEDLLKKGMSNEKAVSEVAKKMKIEASTEEKVKKLEETVKIKRGLFELPAPPPPAPTRRVYLKTISKYFIHGLAFSVLFLILSIAMIFVLAILIGFGFIIGLIIGVGLLFLMVGFLNSIITDFLWFTVSKSFLSILFHGIVLSVTLIVVNIIFIWAPNLVFPNVYVEIITFIIGTFLNGLIGKTVATIWEET